jgi:hypothetical protein
MLLTAGSKKTREGGIFCNALQAASAYGHLDVLHLLRQEGADVNAQGGYFGNALKLSQPEVTRTWSAGCCRKERMYMLKADTMVMHCKLPQSEATQT